MMQHLGARIGHVLPGKVEISLPFSDKVSQQHGAFHGGAVLRATGRVIKPGWRVIVTSADVIHVADDGTATPCAVMQQTLAQVPKND